MIYVLNALRHVVKVNNKDTGAMPIDLVLMPLWLTLNIFSVTFGILVEGFFFLTLNMLLSAGNRHLHVKKPD